MTLRTAKFSSFSPEAGGAPPRLTRWPSLAPEQFPRASPDPSGKPDEMTAFAQGFEAGRRAKAAELDAALETFARAHEEISAKAEMLEDEYRRRSAAILARIVSAAAPAILEAAAMDAIRQIFNDGAGIGARPEMSLHVAPDIDAIIRPHLTDRMAEIIVPDAALAAGSLRARWRDGGVDCDVGRSLFAIVEFLNAQTGPAAEEA